MPQVRSLSSLDVRGTLILATVANFPDSPRDGETVVKDGVLWMYTHILGVAAWRPLSKRTTSYVHTQGAAASTWLVTHNFGTRDLMAVAYNEAGVPQYASVEFVDDNAIRLVFSESLAGRAVLFADADIGVSPSGAAGGAPLDIATIQQPGSLVPFAGTARWYPPFALTLKNWQGYLGTAPQGADVIYQLRKNGVIVATATIGAGQNRASTSALDITLTENDYLTLDIIQVGSVVTGSDLTVRFFYEAS